VTLIPSASREDHQSLDKLADALGSSSDEEPLTAGINNINKMEPGSQRHSQTMHDEVANNIMLNQQRSDHYSTDDSGLEFVAYDAMNNNNNNAGGSGGSGGSGPGILSTERETDDINKDDDHDPHMMDNLTAYNTRLENQALSGSSNNSFISQDSFLSHDSTHADLANVNKSMPRPPRTSVMSFNFGDSDVAGGDHYQRVLHEADETQMKSPDADLYQAKTAREKRKLQIIEFTVPANVDDYSAMFEDVAVQPERYKSYTPFNGQKKVEAYFASEEIARLAEEILSTQGVQAVLKKTPRSTMLMNKKQTVTPRLRAISSAGPQMSMSSQIDGEYNSENDENAFQHAGNNDDERDHDHHHQNDLHGDHNSNNHDRNRNSNSNNDNHGHHNDDNKVTQRPLLEPKVSTDTTATDNGYKLNFLPLRAPGNVGIGNQSVNTDDESQLWPSETETELGSDESEEHVQYVLELDGGNSDWLNSESDSEHHSEPETKPIVN
jgi:hypothetical protein